MQKKSLPAQVFLFHYGYGPLLSFPVLALRVKASPSLKGDWQHLQYNINQQGILLFYILDKGAEAAAYNGCCLFLSGVVKFMQLSVIASHYQLILDIYFCKRYQTQSHFKTGAAEYKSCKVTALFFLNSPTR
jgi:hypothetical protein